MLENISIATIRELTKLRLNLSQIWLLERFYQNKGTKEDDNLSYQSLERKLMVIDGKITEQGKTFYDQITSLKEDSPPIEIKKVNEVMKDQFEEFWNIYPRTATFTYKNHNFQGSRALRVGKKEEMRVKWMKILSTGEYSAQDIIKALQHEILEKKEQSIKTGQNKLEYLKAMPSYLNSMAFVPYIEVGKNEEDTNITNMTIDI